MVEIHKTREWVNGQWMDVYRYADDEEVDQDDLEELMKEAGTDEHSSYTT